MGVTQEIHMYFLSEVHTRGGAYTHTCIGVTQEVHIVTQAVHMYFLSDVMLGVFWLNILGVREGNKYIYRRHSGSTYVLAMFSPER